MYIIEENVPIPQKRGNNKGKTDFLRILQVGDSFVEVIPRNKRRAISSFWRATARRIGIKIQTYYDAESGGLRIWRIK
jgi:hypothetical protein